MSLSKKKHSNLDFPIPTHLNPILLPMGNTNNEYSVYGQLICTCGNKSFALSANEEKTNVHAKCTSCNQKYEIFDYEKHGWDGFVCNTVYNTIKQMHNLTCSNCNNNNYKLFITIHSQGKEDFIEESSLKNSLGTTLDIGDWINAFEWISIDLECSDCKQKLLGWLDFETM